MKLSRKFISLMVIATLAAVPFCLASDAKTKTQIELLEIRITKAEPSLKLLNTPALDDAPTQVSLALTYADKFIIKLIPKESDISLLDDKGRVMANLSEQTRKSGQSFGKLKSLPPTGSNSNKLLFAVSSYMLPTKGSQKLTLKGYATVEIGLDKQVAEQKDIAFKTGSKITAGPAEFAITVDQPLFDNCRAIYLKTSQPCRNIKAILFYDQNGKAIQAIRLNCQLAMPWPNPLGEKLGTSSSKLSYVLEANPKTINVKVIYFKKSKKIKIPIYKTFSLGL